MVELSEQGSRSYWGAACTIWEAVKAARTQGTILGIMMEQEIQI